MGAPPSDGPGTRGALSRYQPFTRDEWARLRAATPLTLTEEDLDTLRGINERLSLEEVADIYLPLSRLLNLYVAASQDLHAVDRHVPRHERWRRRPYVIGVAGSVAVGKSTTARILQALLARWPDHPKVDLVTTDGFLFPNAVLEERGLMERKGFPESYDVRRLVRFLAEVKSGRPEVQAPVYSHMTTTSCPARSRVVQQPDIVIVEGLNGAAGERRPAPATPAARSCPTSSTSRSTSTPRSGHRAVVPRAVPRAARDGVPRPQLVLPSLRRAAATRPRRSRSPAASGGRSTAATCARTSSPPAGGARLILEKGPTTPSGRSGCGSCRHPAGIKRRYRKFAETECRGYSDAYYRLALAVAEDDHVVGFLSRCP